MRPDVDWNSAAKAAQWWAMDADGEADWFSFPDVPPFTDFWFTDSKRASLFEYEGD